MYASTLTVTDAVRHFSDYINRVTYRRESFVLCKGNKLVAELRPVPCGRRLGDLPAVLHSLPHLSKNDAKGFIEDIKMAKDDLPSDEMRDPWAY